MSYLFDVSKAKADSKNFWTIAVSFSPHRLKPGTDRPNIGQLLSSRHAEKAASDWYLISAGKQWLRVLPSVFCLSLPVKTQ